MKHTAWICTAVLLAAALSGCGGGSTAETEQAGGSYESWHFAYTVSDALTLKAQNEELEFTSFYVTEGEDFVLLVSEQEYTQMTVDAYCAYFYRGTEFIYDEAFTLGKMNGRYFTCEHISDSTRMDAEIVVECEGNVLSLSGAGLTQDQLAVFEQECEKILKSLTFTAVPPEAGTCEGKFFSVSYTDSWYPFVDEGAECDVHMRLTRAESAEEFLSQVYFYAYPDAAETPEEAMQRKAEEYAESESRADIVQEEGTVFGTSTWVVSCENTVASNLSGKTGRMENHFFTENGILYEVQLVYFEESRDAFMEDLEGLEVKLIP